MMYDVSVSVSVPVGIHLSVGVGVCLDVGMMLGINRGQGLRFRDINHSIPIHFSLRFRTLFPSHSHSHRHGNSMSIHIHIPMIMTMAMTTHSPMAMTMTMNGTNHIANLNSSLYEPLPENEILIDNVLFLRFAERQCILVGG
jgi:hypothetical protein